MNNTVRIEYIDENKIIHVIDRSGPYTPSQLVNIVVALFNNKGFTYYRSKIHSLWHVELTDRGIKQIKSYTMEARRKLRKAKAFTK